jgi:hypothetical protein
MFGWLRSFIRREVIADVPPELDLCQECGKLACSEGEFETCARRKERAEVLREAKDQER